MTSPTPAEIKQARLSAGLTQTQAAALVYKSMRGWQQWELGERKMPRSDFELFLIKSTGN